MSMLVLEKHRVDALFGVGYEFQKSAQFAKAIGAYREAIRRAPRHTSARNNLGNCYRSIGRYEDALAQYNEALEIEPSKSSTLLNKSLALLALNRYEEAWPLYRSRLNTITYRNEVLTSGKPQWDGRELGGNQRLFIYSNQGLGDEIQALRYLPLVAERAAHIILEVQKPNFELLKSFPGISEVRVRPTGDTSLPDFDCQCESFTLAEIFQTTFQAVPPPCRPPFEPDREILRIIGEEKARFPGHKHIGLVWSGNPKNDLNPYRACGLIHQLPLLEVENCRFYSLQKGAPKNDVRKFQDHMPGLTDLSDHLPNMASTATAIDALDLLITTDTSVPHLAGSLGDTNTWVLLHQPTDWRWTVDKDVSPWYPNAKLFRQSIPGVWTNLIDLVKEELKHFAHST